MNSKLSLLCMGVIAIVGCAKSGAQTEAPVASSSAMPMSQNAHTTMPMSESAHAAMGDSAPAPPASSVAYTCSMHPEIERPGPGTCPICNMKLVPKRGK